MKSIITNNFKCISLHNNIFRLMQGFLEYNDEIYYINYKINYVYKCDEQYIKMVDKKTNEEIPIVSFIKYKEVFQGALADCRAYVEFFRDRIEIKNKEEY